MRINSMKHFTQTYSRKNGTRRHIHVEVQLLFISQQEQIFEMHRLILTFIYLGLYQNIRVLNVYGNKCVILKTPKDIVENIHNKAILLLIFEPNSPVASVIIHSRRPLPQPTLTIASQFNFTIQIPINLKFSSVGKTQSTLFLFGCVLNFLTIVFQSPCLYNSVTSSTISSILKINIPNTSTVKVLSLTKLLSAMQFLFITLLYN